MRFFVRPLVPAGLIIFLCTAAFASGATSREGLSQVSAGSKAEAMIERLTLDQVVTMALANNPELAASRGDLEAASAKAAVAEAARRPQLNVEAGFSRFVDPQRLASANFNGESGVFDDELYRADLNLRLPLYTGGRLNGEIDAARQLQQSQEHLSARSREELVYNLTSTFLAMLGQQDVIRSLDFSVKAMAEHRNQVEKLFQAEKAAQVDLLRVQVRLADLKQTLRKENNRLTLQKRLLINLIGNELNPANFEISGALETEQGPLPTAAAALSRALQQRSDYLAARKQLAAQQQRIKIATAGHLPTLSLAGSYGLRQTGSGESEDLGSVGLVLNLPLFEGGGIAAKIRQEQAVSRAASNRLHKLELQIRLEVESALLDIEANQERLLTTREVIEQARESLRIERLKYDLASGSLTDVLDVQTALLQAETSYVSALADLNLAAARLRLATGEIFP